MKKIHAKIIRDVCILVCSIVLAIFLVKTDSINAFLGMFQGQELLSTWLTSFIAGICFTSIFTTLPAMVALGEVSQHTSPWLVAAIGASGSLIGDMVIFQFVKNDVSSDMHYILSRLPKKQKVFFRHLLHYKGLRWFMRLAGALIIASPLPDELGIALLGLSSIKTSVMIPLLYTFNFLGIAFIGLISQSL